jgi:type IV secretion system protein VirD4
VEVGFAPKELRLAQDLSERLGYTTVRSPARSRPTGLSRGHRSISESDQRRALLLPQELTRLPPETLLVLKAGLPPVRGRKITYYRERVFARRVRPPPPVAPVALVDDLAAPAEAAGSSSDPLTLDVVAATLARAGLEPLPPHGATPAAVEAWVDRFIDGAAHVDLELDDGR